VSGFAGADVDQVEALARRLEKASNRLDSITSQASFSLMTAAWTGADIDDVRSNWNGRTKPNLAAAARSLDSLSLDLKRQAEQQRQTSAVGASTVTGGGFSGQSGSGTGSGSRSDSNAPDWMQDILEGFTGDSGQNFAEGLESLIKRGVDIGGLITDYVEIKAILDFAASNGLKTVDFLGDSGAMKFAGKLGSVFSVVGGVLDTKDLLVAIGENDQPQILDSSLDVAVDVLGIWAPGAGLAWELGKGIGTGIYELGQLSYDTDESATRSALHDMYGPGYTTDNLTQKQAAELAARYDGVGGFFNAQYDALAGMAKDMFGLYS
jgi:hypothetical protein